MGRSSPDPSTWILLLARNQVPRLLILDAAKPSRGENNQQLKKPQKTFSPRGAARSENGRRCCVQPWKPPQVVKHLKFRWTHKTCTFHQICLPGQLQTTQISPMSQLLDATTLLASPLTTATLRLQVLHHHVKNTKSILYNKQYGFGQFWISSYWLVRPSILSPGQSFHIQYFLIIVRGFSTSWVARWKYLKFHPNG